MVLIVVGLAMVLAFVCAVSSVLVGRPKMPTDRDVEMKRRSLEARYIERGN